MSARAALCATALTAFVVWSAGCGLDPGGAWNRTDGAGPVAGSTLTPTDDATQRVDAVCPATSSVLPGRRGPFEACTTSADCSPTCCSCPVEPQNWLASSCVNGACADGATSCARTQPTYCTVAGAAVVRGVVSAPPACDTCINTYCGSAEESCNENAACVSLESCSASCGSDAACAQSCFDASPQGAADLQALDDCVAQACGVACEP